MEKKITYLSCFSQKGGVGKTTFNVLLSSIFYYVYQIPVILVDCDYPQYSVNAMRQRDSELVQNDPYLKSIAYKQFTRLKRPAYPVLCSTSENAIKTAEEYINKHHVDHAIVLFDLTGTVRSKGLLNVISKLNFIFIPIIADRVVLASSLNFANVVNKTLIRTGESAIKRMCLFWNQYDGREKTQLYDIYETVIHDLRLELLNTVIPDRKNFRKEIVTDRRLIFRSTLFPPSKSLFFDSNLEKLMTEIMNILNAV